MLQAPILSEAPEGTITECALSGGVEETSNPQYPRVISISVPREMALAPSPAAKTVLLSPQAAARWLDRRDASFKFC